jgi:hypothetical protein
MPTVPFQRTGISTEVLGYDVGSRGGVIETSRALAGIGQELTQTGLELNAELKKSEAVTAVTTKFQQRSFESQDYFEKLKRSNPNGFMRDENGNDTDVTITKHYREWLNERFEKDQTELPSKLAQDMYVSEVGGYFNDEVKKSQATEWTLRVENQKNLYVDQIRFAANRIKDNPFTGEAYKELDRIRNSLKQQQAAMGPDGKFTGLFSSNEVHDLDKMTLTNVPANLFDGLYNKAKEAEGVDRERYIKEALSVVRGEDMESRRRPEKARLSMLLDPGVKADIEAKFLNLRDSNKRDGFDMRELSQIIQDDEVSRFQGRQASPLVMNKLQEYVNAADTPQERKSREAFQTRMWNRLNVADGAGSIISDMRGLNPNAWGGLISSFDSRIDSSVARAAKENPNLEAAAAPNYDAEVRNSYRRQIDTAMDRILAERKKDAAQYVYNEFPGVKSQVMLAGGDPKKNEAAISASLRKQAALGIPSDYQRYISKGESLEISKLLNSNNPELVTQSLTRLESKYGQYWDEVLTQVQADKNLADGRDGLAVALRTSDPIQRENAVASIVNAKAINKAYDDAFPLPADQKMHQLAITQATDTYIKAIQSGSSAGNTYNYANEIRALAELEFKRIKANPVNRNLSDKEVANLSMKTISANHTALEVAGSFINYPNIYGPSKVAEAYLSSHKRPDALAEMGIPVPAAMPNQPDFAKKSPEERKQLYLKSIVERGQWVNSPTGTGVRLQIMNADGSPAYVRGPDGGFLEIKFKDMHKQDKFTSRELQPGFFGRFFEGAAKAIRGSSNKLEGQSDEVSPYGF